MYPYLGEFPEYFAPKATPLRTEPDMIVGVNDNTVSTTNRVPHEHDWRVDPDAGLLATAPPQQVVVCSICGDRSAKPVGWDTPPSPREVGRKKFVSDGRGYQDKHVILVFMSDGSIRWEPLKKDMGMLIYGKPTPLENHFDQSDE